MGIKNVLIVDDSIEVQEMIFTFFKSKGLIASLASNIGDALVLINKQKIDLIICDYEMPGGNGDELVEKLRELKYPTKMILFTGRYEMSFVIKEPLIKFFNNKSYIELFAYIDSL